jgi:hypothetical protein
MIGERKRRRSRRSVRSKRKFEYKWEEETRS